MPENTTCGKSITQTSKSEFQTPVFREDDNHSFIPHYFLRYENFTLGDPYATEVPYNENGDLYIDDLSIAYVSEPALFVN
jgi:hypothetical protein